MRKKTPSQASVGHGTRRPERAIKVTIASADAKNSRPGTSRMDVGCHSVTRAVTDAFEVSPAA